MGHVPPSEINDPSVADINYAGTHLMQSINFPLTVKPPQGWGQLGFVDMPGCYDTHHDH